MKIKHNANINTQDIQAIKQMPSNVSFKCVKDIKKSEVLDSVEKEIGTFAADNFKKAIDNLLEQKKPAVTLVDGALHFKDRKWHTRFYQQVLDPLIHMPIDLANSTLIRLKKVFKNSKFIDKMYQGQILTNRRNHLENFANTMAIKHYIEILQDKDKKINISKEALKRFDTKRADYTTKSERSITRIVSGVIPAFFLANDAYNLSIYLNNDKDVAKKQKQRRFNQEIVRVGITAASTFAVLGYYAKKSNANPGSATAIITALTFASEIIGRAMAKTPFYPITKKQAKEYAKLQGKDKTKKKEDNEGINKQIEQKSADKPAKTKSKSDYTTKVIMSLVAIGAGMELLPKYIRPIKNITSKILSNYNKVLLDDFHISQGEFNKLIEKLEHNDANFKQIAKYYRTIFNQIIENGNLTVKEKSLVDAEIDKIVKSKLSNKDLITTKIKDEEKSIKEKINRKEILERLNLAGKNNDEVYIGGNVNKVKDTIGKIILLPIQIIKSILTMPYQYILKPVIELPLNAFKKYIMHIDIPEKYEKYINSEDIDNLINGIKTIRKHYNDDDNTFKNEIYKKILNAFDNVNKSNFSNAELSGSAKTAVSIATSAFLVFDNYNMVMIDSEGKDKKLAGQKAKERILQRIARIAYGACIITASNKIFEKTFNKSLLGAQLVNVGTVLAVEALERTSVGLPLHESTRDEIIEKDNKTLNATGLKGVYFRFMAKLTGKKAISQKVDNK